MTAKSETPWLLNPDIPQGYLKQVAYGKRRYTAINPQYQIKDATERWGPYGHRWGLRNLNWEVFDNIESVRIDQDTGEVLPPTTSREIVLHAEFYYPYEDGEVSFPITVSLPWERNGETYKKLQTLAMSKSFSRLGSGAPIYLGEFDNPENRKYNTGYNGHSGDSANASNNEDSEGWDKQKGCITAGEYRYLRQLVGEFESVKKGEVSAAEMIREMYAKRFPNEPLPVNEKGMAKLNHIYFKKKELLIEYIKENLEAEKDGLPF